MLVVSRAMGKKAIDEKLMNMDLPLAIRRIALSSSRLQIEGPRLGRFNPLGSLVSGEKKDGEKKGHLLPHIRFTDRAEISERRLTEIRNRIRSGYEAVFSATSEL